MNQKLNSLAYYRVSTSVQSIESQRTAMGDSFDEEFGDAGGRGAILAAKRPGFASYWPSSERATRCSFMRWTLVHAVCGTAGHVADVTEGNAMLHGQESVVYADAGYQGAEKRLDARPGVRWSVAMRPGKRKKLDRALSTPLARRTGWQPRWS